MEKRMQAGIFKAKCLKIMDEVKKTKKELTITKHNVPIVKLCPIEEDEGIFGKLKGTLHVKGDIVKPIGEDWDADH